MGNRSRSSSRRLLDVGLLRRLREFVHSEAGVVAPMAILLMPVLLGFCALVLDVGVIYAHRRNLQNAADAAALAGARELQREFLGASVDPIGLAERFAERNGVLPSYGDCATDGSGRIMANGPGALPHSWEVETSRLVGLHFGAVVGQSKQCVRARALAVVTEIQATKIWPWGVLDGVLETTGFNTSIVLKEGAGGSSSGNFGIVDFNCGGGGTPDYEYWAFNGFGTRPGEGVPVRLPGPTDWNICTETGNKAAVNRRLADFVDSSAAHQCVYTPPDVRCPLYGLVPILREHNWPNGTKTVHVVDFAIFELDAVNLRGGHTEISGRFLRYAGGVGPTYTPDPAGQLRGLIGIRLWQ